MICTIERNGKSILEQKSLTTASQDNGNKMKVNVVAVILDMHILILTTYYLQ